MMKKHAGDFTHISPHDERKNPQSIMPVSDQLIIMVRWGATYEYQCGPISVAGRIIFVVDCCRETEIPTDNMERFISHDQDQILTVKNLGEFFRSF